MSLDKKAIAQQLDTIVRRVESAMLLEKRADKRLILERVAKSIDIAIRDLDRYEEARR